MTAAKKRPRDAAPSAISRKKFLGMDMVDAVDLAGIVGALEQKAWRSEPERVPVVVTPNVDIVVQLESLDDEQIEEQFINGWCVLPDGQPLISLSRRCGAPLSARLAGSSLVDAIWPRLALAHERVLVLASNESVAESLRLENPRAVVVVPPMFDGDDPAQVQAVTDAALVAMGTDLADYVFIGIGFPKSSKLMTTMLADWPDPAQLPVILGVGASFEMYFGELRRAPQFVQRMGMEWLFRFAQEPRRLFHRYFVRDSRFLVIAARAMRETR